MTTDETRQAHKAAYTIECPAAEYIEALRQGDAAVEVWRRKMLAKAGAPAYAALRIIFEENRP